MISLSAIDLNTIDMERLRRAQARRGLQPTGPAGRAQARLHVGDTATVLAADLLAGTEDPRRDAPTLLRRALAAQPGRAAARRPGFAVA
jgi:hypothetical protein